MLTIKDLIRELAGSKGDNNIGIYTPSGLAVPSHFHITEIGCVTKKFVDCGGTARVVSSANIQVWIANDVEHQMTVSKLFKIIEAGKDLFKGDEELVFEVENGYTVGLYGVQMLQKLDTLFNIFLCRKNTNCLAPDKCGVNFTRDKTLATKDNGCAITGSGSRCC